MYGLFSKQGWFLAAGVTLFFFVSILVMHPFVPHEHSHDFLEGGLAVTLHTGVAERGDAFFIATSLMLTFALLVTFIDGILPASHRGFQHVDIPIRLRLRTSLARGILNTKVY